MNTGDDWLFRRRKKVTRAYGRRAPASKRSASSGTNERHRPLDLAISNLPQHAVTQESGVALALLGNNNNLPSEEFSFAFSLVGQVENRADFFERSGHRLDVLRPEHAVF